ncbi:Zinc finger protein [Plakobranchus ocellatus]|uniref:Zinc finger protein n=1 Tax=Plakobranchus ocellatus TaxID=259542 RepID=A0AAV3Z9S1_9GAST|nr:Zinc finger protein [Plakobranchus ocellatus]
MQKAQARHYYGRTAKRRKFCVGDKVLKLLPNESRKLLMQWEGPFDVLATPSANDYRINVNGKRKIFYANVLKKYSMRGAVSDETLTGDCFISAASLDVVEDNDKHTAYDAPGCKIVPELVGWGSKRTLKLGDELFWKNFVNCRS